MLVTGTYETTVKSILWRKIGSNRMAEQVNNSIMRNGMMQHKAKTRKIFLSLLLPPGCKQRGTIKFQSVFYFRSIASRGSIGKLVVFALALLAVFLTVNDFDEKLNIS